MHSIIGSWLTLFVSVLDSYDVDGEKFLAERDISYPQSSDPSSRIQLDTMHNLWQEAADVTQDSSIGLRAGAFATPNTFSALGIAMSSSTTVRSMMDILCKYLRVFNSSCSMNIIEQEKDTTMCFSIARDMSGNLLVSPYGIDAAVSAIYSLVNAYKIHGLVLKGITLPYDKPNNHTQYNEYFNCPVDFNGNDLLICYESTYLRQTIPGCSDALAKSAESLIISALNDMESEGIIENVKVVVRNLMIDGNASLKSVAATLNTTTRTLHRRLEEKNTNFRELFDSVRQEQAEMYMRNTRLSLEDVSLLLGFSTHSSYTRAFKRWTGLTPNQYRGYMV